MSKIKFAAFINCIDGRVQSPVSNWLKAYAGVDYTDRITEPGPDKVVAFGTPEKIEAIKQKVLVSINAHGAKIVAIAGHYDCAGNPTSRDEHIKQVKKAVREIVSWNLNVRIIGLWINEKWEVEVVTDTAQAHHHHKGKHVHHGKSTRDLLNANEVLNKAGLKTGDFFLDAGCGDGYISIAASEVVGKNGKVFAVDAHEESIEHVKKELHQHNIRNVQTLTADITHRVPLPDHSVDLILMANVLHGFVENDEAGAVIKEINRILKSGGTLAVVDFKKTEGTPGPPMFVRLSEEETEKLFATHNFKRKKCLKAGAYHYLVLLEKVK